MSGAAPERAPLVSNGAEQVARVRPMSRGETSFVRILEHPNLGVGLALLAFCLTAPSLFIGFHLDDFVGRYIYSDLPGAANLYRVYTGGYGIANGNPADTHWQIEQGYAPWWTYPKLVIAMWRPLGLLTHLYEFRAWPDHAFPMHLHNLLWLALGVLCATRLYRGLMGPLVGGLAATLYAVDHTHGFAAGFICNRYVLLCAAFGTLALDQYCRSREEGAGLGPKVLGPLLYAASLLSGEASISIFFYVVAYAAFADRSRLWNRALAVAPYFLVTVAWRAAYTHLGRGGRFSGLYIDPGREPLHFLHVLFERSPVLLLGELLAPPSDLYMFLSDPGKRLLLGFAFLFFAGLVLAAWPLLRRDRIARFWGAGMLLSLVPASTTHPNNRLLFFVSIGAMGLVAQLWHLYAVELRGAILSLRGRIQGGLAALVLLTHLVASPFALPLVSCSLLLTTPIKRAFADVGPDVEGKDAVFVTSPDQYSVKLMPMQRRVDGAPLPRRWRVLSIGPQGAVRVARVDERTLDVEYDGGLLHDPLSELYRDRRLTMSVGETVPLEGLSIVVQEVTDDGRARRVRFAFDAPLDAPSFRFYYWANNHFQTFVPPPIGQERVLPAARVELGS